MTKRKRKKIEEESKELDLTKKYRPKNIDEFFGNALLKKSIKQVLQKNSIPHAVLFHGSFGSGKTSLARIFAGELNCSQYDLKEIDIADFTGIDLIREIRRKMMTKPFGGSSKVYILDEVHRLSPQGQDGLLKALEEPPSHVYFFLCTTDPNKVINTVKSRCVQYQVQTLSDKQIYSLLQYIAENEDIELEKKVALQIARDSLGHPRNAIKILEKIMHLDQDDMLDAAKQEAEKRERAIALCRAIMDGEEWDKVASILKELTDDAEVTRRTIRSYFATVLLNGDDGAQIVLNAFCQPYYNIDAKNELVRNTFEAYENMRK